MRPFRSIGIVAALVGLMFDPRLSGGASSAKAQPVTPPVPTPAPTPKAKRDGHDDRRSLAARIGTAQTADEVNLFLEEAERVHANNPKALHKCRRKAAARLDYLIPF